MGVSPVGTYNLYGKKEFHFIFFLLFLESKSRTDKPRCNYLMLQSEEIRSRIGIGTRDARRRNTYVEKERCIHSHCSKLLNYIFYLGLKISNHEAFSQDVFQFLEVLGQYIGI